MIHPITLADMAHRCGDEAAHQPFYCRLNRSAGWALCVIVDDTLFFTTPNLSIGEADRLVRELQNPSRREAIARGATP
jgi:hypothetical protein